MLSAQWLSAPARARASAATLNEARLKDLTLEMNKKLMQMHRERVT
jgi:hypothetical protein